MFHHNTIKKNGKNKKISKFIYDLSSLDKNKTYYKTFYKKKLKWKIPANELPGITF